MTEAHDTIANGLKSYAIGSKLRRLRLRKSMGLLELSKHTKLSPGMLSKLERDIMHPTLPTCCASPWCSASGWSTFSIRSRGRCSRSCARKTASAFPILPMPSGSAYYFESLDFSVPNRAFNSYLAEFEPVDPEQCRAHEHAGNEFLYVVSGKLELRVGADVHELSGGDSVYFDSSVPHSYRRAAPARTTALVVSVESPTAMDASRV